MKTRSSIILMSLLLSLKLLSQDVSDYRIPLIGERAPSFKALSTQGDINFPADYFDKWKIIFSHPADFTPVCTSEILALASMEEDFKALNTALLVVSTDGINSHIEWINSIEKIDFNGLGLQKINFPIISDANLDVCRKYGMVEANSGRSNSIRGVFIIDPSNKIQSINFYPVTTGRNLEEIKRILLALQASQKHGVLTPVNWEPGEPVMIPSPATMEEAQKLQKKNDPSLKMVTWYMWTKEL